MDSDIYQALRSLCTLHEMEPDRKMGAKNFKFESNNRTCIYDVRIDKMIYC